MLGLTRRVAVLLRSARPVGGKSLPWREEAEEEQPQSLGNSFFQQSLNEIRLNNTCRLADFIISNFRPEPLRHLMRLLEKPAETEAELRQLFRDELIDEDSDVERLIRDSRLDCLREEINRRIQPIDEQLYETYIKNRLNQYYESISKAQPEVQPSPAAKTLSHPAPPVPKQPAREQHSLVKRLLDEKAKRFELSRESVQIFVDNLASKKERPASQSKEMAVFKAQGFQPEGVRGDCWLYVYQLPMRLDSDLVDKIKAYFEAKGRCRVEQAHAFQHQQLAIERNHQLRIPERIDEDIMLNWNWTFEQEDGVPSSKELKDKWHLKLEKRCSLKNRRSYLLLRLSSPEAKALILTEDVLSFGIFIAGHHVMVEEGAGKRTIELFSLPKRIRCHDFQNWLSKVLEQPLQLQGQESSSEGRVLVRFRTVQDSIWAQEQLNRREYELYRKIYARHLYGRLLRTGLGLMQMIDSPPLK